MTTEVENSIMENADNIDVPSGGRGFLSTLVKKAATDKTVTPRSKNSVDSVEVPNNEHEPRYQNYSEIIQNMSQKAPMSLKEMQNLQENIKNLDQEAHIEICRMLVENQKPGIQPNYTVNNYGTYFDIVDLPTDLLWRIHYYIKLSLEDMARQKVKEEAQREFDRDQAENPQYQKMRTQQNRSQNIFHQALPTYSLDNLPTYEDLREDALRNLKQSQVSNDKVRDDTVNEEEAEEEEISESLDNPDIIPSGDFIDNNTELGDGPSELDDFD